MSVYALNIPTTASVIATPAWDMKAMAANLPKVMQIDLQSAQAVTGAYGMGRPANDGLVVQNGGIPVQSDDPIQPAGQTTCAIQWLIPPTVPVLFHRRVYLPAVVGAAVIWTFPRGLGVLATRGLVLWNIAGNPASLTVNVILDE